MKVTWCWLVCLCLVAAGHQVSSAADKKKAAVKSSSPENEQEKVEAVIEDVNAKQLERLLDEKDYVAVYWYGRNCRQCDKVLHELENIDDETDHFGVHFVKINDKKLSKQYNVKTYPALTYFRNKEPIAYEGDLLDEEQVLEFLTSLEAMDLPDQIEEVNAKILEKIVHDTGYIAVLFYRPQCKKSEKVLRELENIDDEADQLGIAFVKIADEELAEEYSLASLPTLVYYRNSIPVIYEGDLMREEDVLEWLVQNKNTASEEEDMIEDVTAKTLETLTSTAQHLAVLFYDHDDEESQRILTELENIDDECDQKGISFVKIDDDHVAKEYGVDHLPTLVYFENKIPSLYDGDLANEEQVLAWLIEQLASDTIEDITDEMLDKLIKKSAHLAVLFYDKEDSKSAAVVTELENIDDECDQKGISFVKISNPEEAKEYGIDDVPSLIYFENGIPSIYEGDLKNEEKVLDWLIHQVESDEIEDVTDEMLDMLIKRSKHLAVLFYDKDAKASVDTLAELENIDDECDQKGIVFVKIDNEDEAKEYGIDHLPSLVYFENTIPSLFVGDLKNEESVLAWLTHQVESDEIEDVTDEMLDMLIEKSPSLAAFFYDKNKPAHLAVLKELENIDDECDSNDIAFVKISNLDEAKEYGLDELPALVYFENRIPSVYEGNLSEEEQVLSWLVEQKNSDTIEELTDELLENIIKTNEYVVVYFSGPCEEGQKCDSILDQLEEIDDEADEHGIHLVTTEEVEFAKRYGIKTFPTLAFFRNQDPLIYKGDISDEKKVLAWFTDQGNLELADQIEEVNEKMLKKLIGSSAHVVAFFYEEKNKEAVAILKELENIDDECDALNVDFVKISDPGVAPAFKLATLPALVYFRRSTPIRFSGDLMDEEGVLKWVTTTKEQDVDVIEEVDVATLEKMLDDHVNVVVYFYAKGCGKPCEVALNRLENIDDDAERHGIQFVKSTSVKTASRLGIDPLPALVYFEDGQPIRYNGDPSEEADALDWLISRQSRKQSSGRRCQTVGMEDQQQPGKLRKYECCPVSSKSKKKSQKLVKGVAFIGDEDDSDNNGDDYVRDDDFLDDDHNDDNNDDDDTDDKPHHNPSIPDPDQHDHTSSRSSSPQHAQSYDYISDDEFVHDAEDTFEEDNVLDWILEMHHGNTMKNVSRQSLMSMVENYDYLAVVFYTVGEEESERVLRRLELIDMEVQEYGTLLVKCDDYLMSKKYGHRSTPALVFFRHGKILHFEGDLMDEEEVLDWLTDPENMESMDRIERVNRKMFQRILQRSDFLAAFFYSDVDCKQCDKVLEELEHIDDEADSAGIDFVKIDDKDFAREMGVFALPAVVFFRHSNLDPVIYAGDLKNEERLLEWLLIQKDPTSDMIEEYEDEQLVECIRKMEFVAVYFYNKQECEHCLSILDELENIDDDTDRHGISFIKTQDLNIATNFGVHEFPALIYFENQVPSIYEGELTSEDVLQWLIQQKTEDRIETVTRSMLESLLINVQYLAVYFYKPNCKACDQVLIELENIDDECDLFGIQMVKIQDPQLAKRYGIKTFPALVYFRNGNPLLYDGDLKNEDSVLEWLSDDENRELADEIEAVNSRMLERLLDESPFLAVFFYDNDCPDCNTVLTELENIDDEADKFGIDFVKINDEETAKKFGIIHTPALIYFRKRTPMIYDGRSSSSFFFPLILDRFQLLLSLFGTAEPVAYSSFIFATIRASVLPLK
uniref:L(2)01289 long form n=1 Tax=Daphnia magna TaxID=35525 RepID=A0A0N8DDR4_9CRUS